MANKMRLIDDISAAVVTVKSALAWRRLCIYYLCYW